MGGYPWTKIFLFEVLHIAVFYPTRRHVYRAVVLAAMIYIAAQIFLTPEVTDPPTITYAVGSRMAFHFAFTAYLLCAEGSFPDHWRRVRDEVHAGANADGLKNLPSNLSFKKKLCWMLDLAYSIRMIGWVQEPQKGLPPRPQISRRAFLCKTLLKLIRNVIISDLTTLVFTQNPAFDARVHDPTDGPEKYLAAVPFLVRIPYILGYCIRFAAEMNIIHDAAAFVCIGLGFSSPALWSDIWGDWKDAYTVGRLWGQTWHQMMRTTFVGLGRFVANKLLKIPRGSTLSSFIQLQVAFLLSGIFHSAGDFMFEKRIVYRSFKFFLLQPVAIIFEDLVVGITKRLLLRVGVKLEPGKDKRSWAEAAVRVIGYFWVAVWFCSTFPAWQDEASAIGFRKIDRGLIAQYLVDRWKLWV